MATTPLQPIVFNKILSTSWEDIYTVLSPTLRAGIDAVVLNNFTDSSAEFSVRLIQNGTPGEANEVITDKQIRAKSNDLAPSIIGQALVTGGIIQAKASANNTVNINITATLLS